MKLSQTQGQAEFQLRFLGMQFWGAVGVHNEKMFIGAVSKGLSLRCLVEKNMGLPWPDLLPDPFLEQLSLQITGKNESVLSATVTDSQGFVHQGSHFKIEKLHFRCQFNGSRKEVSIELTSSLKVAGILDAQQIKLRFHYLSDLNESAWTLGGKFQANFLGKQLGLEAKLSSHNSRKCLEFCIAGNLPELALSAQAQMLLKDLAFYLSFDSSSPGLLKYELGASGLCQLRLAETQPEKSDFQGILLPQLKIAISYNDETGAALSLSSIDPNHSVKFKLYDAKEFPGIEIRDSKLELRLIPKARQVQVTGTLQFSLYDIPDTIARLFPVRSFAAKFDLGTQGCTISVSLDDSLFKVPLPAQLPSQNPPLPHLGDLYLGLGKLTLGITPKGAILSADFRMGLPPELNSLFKGKPFFRTYQPQNDRQEDLIHFRFGYDAQGLAFTMLNSPFLDIFPITTNSWGKPAVKIDLGESGCGLFSLPEFSLQPDLSLRAAGGFEIEKPFSIPLAPLKMILTQLGMKDFADFLADKIPLNGVSFAPKDSQGKRTFNPAALIELVQSHKAELKFPEWFQGGLDTLRKLGGRLPDRFLDYGEIILPDSLYFELNYDASQSLNCKFSVINPKRPESAQPFKIMYPYDPLCTQLVGIRLYGFSFGEIFAGNLFRMDIDAELDFFDVPTLLMTALLEKETELLADPKQLQRTIFLRNTVFLVVYQAGFPIPIPLFFDRVGFKVKDISGMEAASSFSFPFPKITVQHIQAFVSLGWDIYSAVKNGKVPDFGKYKDLKLAPLTAERSYIRLPKFISREKVKGDSSASHLRQGSYLYQAEGFDLDFLNVLLVLADALQGPSLNRLIQVIALNNRMSTTELFIFDLLDIKLQYALATPFELVNSVFSKWNISEEEQEKFRKLIAGPSPHVPVKENTEGLAAIASGVIDLAEMVHLETHMGLALSSSGLKMMGEIRGWVAAESGPPMVAVNLGGQFALSPLTNQAGLSGNGNIMVRGINLLHGKFQLSETGFELEVAAGAPELFLSGLKGTISGQLNQDGIELAGKLGEGNAKIGGVPIGMLDFFLRNDQVRLKGKLFDLDFALELAKASKGLEFSGKMKSIRLGALEISRAGTVTEGDEYDGPCLAIGPEKFQLNGRIKFLALTQEVDIDLQKKKIKIHLAGQLSEMIRGNVEVEASSFSPNASLAATIRLETSSFLTAATKALSEFAKNTIKQLKDAIALVDQAKNRAYKAGRAVLANLHEQAERFKSELQKAKHAMELLQEQVEKHKQSIADLKQEIDRLNRERPFAWFLAVAGLESAKWTAEKLLDAANVALKGSEILVQEIQDTIDKAIALAGKGLELLKAAADKFLKESVQALEMLECGIGEFQRLAKPIAEAGTGFLELHSIEVCTDLNNSRAKNSRSLMATVDASLLQVRKEYYVYFNFNSVSTFVNSLILNIRNGMHSPRSFCQEALENGTGAVDICKSLWTTFPDIGVFDTVLAMHNAGYSPNAIGEALNHLLREFDLRKQEVVKALRIVLEQKTSKENKDLPVQMGEIIRDKLELGMHRNIELLTEEFKMNGQDIAKTLVKLYPSSSLEEKVWLLNDYFEKEQVIQLAKESWETNESDIKGIYDQAASSKVAPIRVDTSVTKIRANDFSHNYRVFLKLENIGNGKAGLGYFIPDNPEAETMIQIAIQAKIKELSIYVYGRIDPDGKKINILELGMLK